MVFLFLVSRVKMNFQRFGVTTAITTSSGMYTILSNKKAYRTTQQQHENVYNGKGARFAQVRGKDTEKRGAPV